MTLPPDALPEAPFPGLIAELVLPSEIVITGRA